MILNKMIIRIWLQPPSRPFQQQRPIDPSLTLRVIFLNSIVKTKICQLKTQDPVMTDFLRLAPNPTPPAASPTRSPGSQRGLPASPTSPTKRPRLHLPRSFHFLLLSPKKFPPTWCATSYSAVKISSPIKNISSQERWGSSSSSVEPTRQQEAKPGTSAATARTTAAAATPAAARTVWTAAEAAAFAAAEQAWAGEQDSSKSFWLLI